MTVPTLPPDVIEAIERDNRILAIKRLREVARVDLKTAHDMVEAYVKGRPLPSLPGLSVSSSSLSEAAASGRSHGVLPDDVLDALRTGHRIEAIKRLREATGLGLKEAKDLVEAHEADGAGVGGRRPSAVAPMPTVVSGRGSLGTGGLLVLLVLSAACAWWLLH